MTIYTPPDTLQLPVVLIEVRTMFRIYLAVAVVWLGAAATAQQECEGLAPKGGEEINESFKGNIQGEIEGIVSRIAGGSASIEGEYSRLRGDTLVNYPEANKVYVWQSIIYLACVRPEAAIDITSLFELYLGGPPGLPAASIENNGNSNININGSENSISSN